MYTSKISLIKRNMLDIEILLSDRTDHALFIHGIYFNNLWLEICLIVHEKFRLYHQLRFSEREKKSILSTLLYNIPMAIKISDLMQDYKN